MRYGLCRIEQGIFNFSVMDFTRQDLTPFTLRHFFGIHDPCLWFAVQSMEVGDRLAFVYALNASRRAVQRPGIPITEWSITEKILFDLNQSRSHYPRHFGGVEMWRAQYEPTEGNDIDLWIQYSFGWVHFMVQAKRQYPSRHYEKIWEHNRHGYQVDVLLRASVGKGTPLYLLYNTLPSGRARETHCTYTSDATQYGCTVAHASRIRPFLPAAVPMTTPTFDRLHPSPPTIAFPWIVLVCCKHDSKASLGRALGLGEEESNQIPVSDRGPEGTTFEYLPPSLEGENAEPVSYYRVEEGSPSKRGSEADPIPGRYYAPYLLAMRAD